jgi:type IV pilus assembly protein PilB
MRLNSATLVEPHTDALSPLLKSEAHSRQITMRLGDRLVDRGIITESQLKQALESQRRHNGFLGQVLIDLGFISSSEMGRVLAEDFGMSYVNVADIHPEPDVLSLVTEELVRATQAIPFRLRDDMLDVAMVDPLDVSAIDRVYAATGKRINPMLSMAHEFQRAVNALYSCSVKTVEALEALEAEETASTPRHPGRAETTSANDAPIVKLVQSVLQTAAAMGASDIHLEPNARGVRIRYRVDGSLSEFTEVPASQRAALIARVKVLCEMDITESRRPQDGRLQFEDHGKATDVRVSSVPTPYGEKIVMRLLDKSAVLVPLTKLGFRTDERKRVESLIRQPHGMLLVVGPTGSGKSTTLYACLNILNDSSRNIMTLEDPIEYDVDGLNQVQVNSRIGLTFASGLRTFVRQDPDVIFVGEVRDGETAEIAVQASLTGHLLLSTLHTNSAVGTIARLVNLGLDPFLIGQALSGVVSQRLVAKLCDRCSDDRQVDADFLHAVGVSEQEARGAKFRTARGCKSCHYRGVNGRVGVYEVLSINESMQRLIRNNAPDAEMQAAAEATGMRSIRSSALALACEGTISLEEMARVVRMVDSPAAAGSGALKLAA